MADVDLSDLIADLRLFAMKGAGYWRISPLTLPALDQLPAVRAAAESADPNARLDAVEQALREACQALASPWQEIAEDYLGLSERGRKFSSVSTRRGFAAERLGLVGETNYRKRRRQLIEGRFVSWEEKTLTLVAENLLRQRAADEQPAADVEGAPSEGPVDLGEPALPTAHPILISRLLRERLPASRRSVLVLIGVAIVVAGSIVAAVFMLGGSSPKPSLTMEGSVGVANVTNGDDKYSSSVLAKDGDVVKFQIYGRNRELTEAIDGLHVTYSLASLDGSQADFRIRFSGGDVIPRADEAQVIPEDGEKATLEIERVPLIVKVADPNGGYGSFRSGLATPGHGSVAIPLLEPQAGQDAFTVAIWAKVHVT